MTINISGSASGYRASVSVTRKGATTSEERTVEQTFSESLCEGDTVVITHLGAAATTSGDTTAPADDGETSADETSEEVDNGAEEG